MMVSATLMKQIVALCHDAGEAILDTYNSADIDLEYKQDDSPLTAADLASHHTLMAGLAKLTPDIPVHSEESEGIDWETRRHWTRYWLVDPLDGTKEFVRRNGEFTVNVALIDQGVPVLGVVHVPVTGRSYYGGQTLGAFCHDGVEEKTISVRPLARSIVMVASRLHGAEKITPLVEAVAEQLGPVELTNMGSSLKLCLVAEGVADIYPRLAPTCEWDTAAADAIVRAAGGSVVDTNFQPLRYGKENILNPDFLVLGSPIESWTFLRPLLSAGQ